MPAGKPVRHSVNDHIGFLCRASLHVAILRCVNQPPGALREIWEGWEGWSFFPYRLYVIFFYVY